MIIKKLFTLCTIAVVILSGSCKKDDFVEIDGVCPVVISTIPINGATDVPLDQVISVTFNEEMDPSTITQSSFTIKGLATIQGTISYQGTTATFVPSSPLSPNTTYTGTVRTTVKDKTGNALQQNYVWTFSTGAVLSPMVIMTDPTDLETNVNLNKIIMATFNMPMASSSINTTTFTIDQSGVPISGTVSYTGTTASFFPSNDLKANTTYTGTITTGAKNPAGLSLVRNYVWTFTTGATMAPMVISTDPSNNALEVGLNKIVTATFSEPMNPSTINISTFTMRQGATVISGKVTYSGTTATFTPDQPFLPSTLYTGTISKNAKNLIGISITEDYIWSFTTLSGVAPVVISTDPAANETDVVVNKTISATFSEVMNAATINTTTFTLKQGNTNVPGTVTYSGNTAYFNPSTNLVSGTEYTATITNGVKNQAGVAMLNNYLWNFTTGSAVAPTVISTDPANNATNVNLNKVITATFSVPMDPNTINGNTFILKSGSSIITGTVTYSGSTASFSPTISLVTGSTYTATITTGAKNTAGTPLAENYSWSFSTGAVIAPTVLSTDPINGATGVSLNKTITATFSVPMDPSTINAATFTLRNGTTLVTGTISYTGSTASFNPLINLLPSTQYTATITIGAKNVAGTAMAENYNWSFTTAAGVPPTVISIDPTNNATGVALNKTITATFSVPMDPTTINAGTFTIRNGATSVSGAISYSGLIASFQPGTNLTPGTIYTATITTGAKNAAGISLVQNYIWSFTTSGGVPPTVISTDPTNNAVEVPLDKTISATFSTPMDQTTINTTTFTLKIGANPVTGSVSYSGTTATFNPTANLQQNTTYTAKISSVVRNAAGTSMTADYIWSFTTKPPVNPPFVDLGNVLRFGIIAGVGVSNNSGISQIINMDVGISPGVRSSITGFPPAIIVNGAMFASDDISPPGVAAMLSLAKTDLTNAYNFAEGATNPAPALVSGDLGGTTLTPGIYKTNSTLSVQSGNLTLNAQGNPNAVWIFQIASSLTTVGGAGGSIILSGGARAENIFWQIGSSATIGGGTSFKGNILALTSITMNTGANAEGRMLCINGAVVMTGNNIIIKP